MASKRKRLVPRREVKVVRHPSGRPVHHSRYRELGFVRAPRDEPLSPGLRRSARVEAIGFHHVAADEWDDDEGRWR